ncbi:helix-hairpin-helix domain-containing protein [Halanaerobium hydrogeniformans]|uniref:Competence protein ComEA helix-hairpin-helix repeat protein n=1 Tax=Halanaerobium hydrogeniformans TaxID=656519 RepID=E4RIP5_HALHG|nr:helix-hairpin-helix domain-containing protein [Halanaerobium hydrogeniformans]ADQ15115.1 competence protein ComEA helix-hairpin-helix repeat protein [Halanaerobium hydrogeniformans]
MFEKLNKKYFVLVILVFFSLFSYFFNSQENYNMDFNQNTEKVIEIDQNLNVVENNFTIIVHLTGEVNNPGVYQLEDGARLVDLLKIAGGLTDKADLELINLAVSLVDGQKIIIPNKNARERGINNHAVEQNLTEPDNLEFFSENNNNSLININRADANELVNLSGIGEAKARAIISYREENGHFQTKEDLINISGIGEKTLDNIRDEISLR